MRKWRNDFRKNNETYYDLIDDFDLIESSFAQQYGIRLRNDIDTMKWGEFSSLLSGISSKTALGNIVRIRSENDPNILKNFTQSEKEIRAKWLKRKAKEVSREEYEQAIESIKNMFKAMAEQNIKK